MFGAVKRGMAASRPKKGFCRMTPRKFLDTIVRLDVADLHEKYDDLRKAQHAIASVDALAAHMFVWAKTNKPAAVPMGDDSAYRQQLAVAHPVFGLLRDIAKAQKHVHLTRHNPQVTDVSQVTSRTIGWGEGGYGEGRYGGVQQVVVDIAPDKFSYVEAVVDEALAVLESEMAVLGC